MPRILVVDDSPTENFKISGVLKRHGHEVLAAESGEQALQVARDSQPDLILMDIVMPGLNGFQATRQLTRDPATSAIPVVMLTAKSQEADLFGDVDMDRAVGDHPRHPVQCRQADRAQRMRRDPQHRVGQSSQRLSRPFQQPGIDLGR